MNGWQDAIAQALGGAEPQDGTPLPQVRESAIAHPPYTIVFGEKASAAAGFYVALSVDASQYQPEREQGRHGGTPGLPNRTGRSNYAFGDGSVWALRYGKVTYPVNLWAATDEGRTQYGVCAPH